jgi:hypothetical protein
MGTVLAYEELVFSESYAKCGALIQSFNAEAITISVRAK